MAEKLKDAMSRIREYAPLRQWCEAHLNPVGRSFECPICHSGTGPNKTPAFTITSDGRRWKCWSCGNGGDVYDLAGIVYNTDDKGEQCNRVAEWAGVEGWGDTWRDWDGNPTGRTEGASKRRNADNGTNTRNDGEKPRDEDEKPENDYTEGRNRHREYIKECQKRLKVGGGMAGIVKRETHKEAWEYLESRGIGPDAVEAWGLGYDPNVGYAKDADGEWCRRGRIVIPWPSVDGEAPYYHIDRSIDPTAKSAKYIKPKRDEVGPQPLWNPDALKAPVFFVVEGALDALAVQACGHEAVAICSKESGNIRETLLTCDDMGIPIVMLDNDEDESKGQKSQRELCEALEAAGRDYLSAPTEEMGVKDPFDAWREDGASLMYWLGDLRDQAIADRERREDERYAKAMRKLKVRNPLDVVDRIYTLRACVERVPTGISAFDRALNGGLPSPGVTVYGAVSSGGKTTLMVQMCDHWASMGIPVLLVTIEQTADEIVAKSISRLIGLRPRSSGMYMRASAEAVMSRKERERWTAEDPEKEQAFYDACNEYTRIMYGPDGRQRLYIMESEGRPTVDEIKAVAERIAKHDGRPPIVAIDYLQLLGAGAGHERDQERLVINDNMMALRQMANHLGGVGTCVVVTSALNRASYSGSIDMDSFRESSGIEFSADLIFGIQPAKYESELEDVTNETKAKSKAKKLMREFKKASMKECELVTLKNRNGRIPENVQVRFEAVSSMYTSGGADRDKPWM